MSNLSFSQKSGILKFKCGIPPGKRLWNFITEKGFSAPQKLSDFSKKKVIKKQWFQFQKLEKYMKSKNDINRPLGAFNKELWANFEFQKSDIYELFPPRKKARKTIDGKCFSAPRKQHWFRLKKHEKYFKSKNDFKKLLGAFDQELWPNLNFHKPKI